MTLSIQNVGRVRADEEANGAFAAEATLGSMEDVPVIEGSVKVTMDRPYESPKMLQQHIDGQPSKVAMPRRASLSCSLNMRGTTVRGTSTLTEANVLPAGRHLFKVAMGEVNYGTGTTIASTSTVSVLNVTAAAGLLEGGAVVLATGVGGALECREIKQITGNAVTLKVPLSSAPAIADLVLACVTYSLGNLDGSTVTSLQLLVEGLDALDRWLLKGGQISAPPKFSLQPGTIPTVDWAWQFADHKKADGAETAMDPSLTALGDQNYTDSMINAVMESELRVVQHGASTLVDTLVDASDISIEPNIVYEPHTTPGGVNNIKQWVRTRASGPAVTGSFLLPYESTYWRESRDIEQAYALSYQIGSSMDGGGFMISVPHVVVDSFDRETVGGIAGQRVTWFARLDTQTNDNSTPLQKSALRVHMF